MSDKELTRMFRIGQVIFMIGLLFGISETIYFGSHYYPSCPEEFKCDIWAAKICGAGIGILSYALIVRVCNHFNL